MNDKLLRLADKKIEQMKHYNEITSQIIYEDIDGVGDLLDRRQEIITAMDGISVDMKQYVSDQTIERQEKLNSVLQSKEINDLTDDLLELQVKIRTISKLKEEIIRNDRLATDRIKKLRDEAHAELVNSAKNKRTIDYCAPNSAAALNKGKKLNITN